jgi:hypothetical protein
MNHGKELFLRSLQRCNGKGRARYAKHRGERAAQGAFPLSFTKELCPLCYDNLMVEIADVMSKPKKVSAAQADAGALIDGRAQEGLTKPKLASECGGETPGVEPSRHRDKSSIQRVRRAVLAGAVGAAGAVSAGRLGFDGKRASGKLCLVLSGIARHACAGNATAGRDPRSSSV